MKTKNNSEEMPVWDHLKELRNSFIRAGIALFLSAGIAFSFSDRLLLWLTHALPKEGVDGRAPLVFISPAEVFLTDIKIALYGGFALAIPIIFYEIWRFISPGLFQKERRSLYPVLIFGSLSFYVGMAFCYFFALPFALDFLVSYGQARGIVPAISVSMYVDFNLKFLFAFGLIFELPIVMALLSKTGILTVPFLTHNRKYAIIIAFFSAAILTPTPDIFNQCLMALPLIILYEVGILAARFFGRKIVVTEKAVTHSVGDTPSYEEVSVARGKSNVVEIIMNNVTIVGGSDVGLVRAKNQDVFGVFPELSMAIVADGMGGRPKGEVASKMAMDAICEFLRNEKGENSMLLADLSLLHKAIVYANQQVFNEAIENTACRGMGTTVVAMLVYGEEVLVGFAGDSRAYLHRDGVLKQITEDHSVTNEYIRAGVITREQAKTHPLRHVISRGVGVEPTVSPETFKASAQAGDIFLLCTDGLSNMIEAETMSAILTQHKENLSIALENLIEGAKAAGGKDNITVVLVRYN
jgi:sec-independent protein translocase protein TatC